MGTCGFARTASDPFRHTKGRDYGGMTDANSGEVIGEGFNDLFGYVAMDIRQPFGNRHAAELLWGSLAESYAEGGCEIHVYFRAGFVDGGVAGNWCTIFNRAEDWLDFVSFETVDPERDGSGSDKRNVRQTVLVFDGKLVELPEGIVGKSLPSIVRLQPLDNDLCAWVNPSKHAVEFFQVIFATRAEDREGRIALDSLGHSPLLIGNGEFKDEVIERVAEVLETVADDEAKLGNGRWLEEFDPEDILRAINIGFGVSAVRVTFAPSSQFCIKALQVVDRSV
jgi:hypothetical protein